MFKRTHVLQLILVFISADTASQFVHILLRKRPIMEFKVDAAISCGMLKICQTTDSIFGWTNICIINPCGMGYLHGQQPYPYWSYDQRNRSSPMQINIFFGPVHLKTDIYIANNTIFIKGITVHLFSLIFVLFLV